MKIDLAVECPRDHFAAVISRGRIEIRHHRNFPPERVREILRGLLAGPVKAEFRDGAITYGGKFLP